MKLSKNGEALGCDDFQAELNKFIPPVLKRKITYLLKMSFGGSEDVEYGHETLVRLQIAGKTKATRKDFVRNFHYQYSEKYCR